MTGDQDMVSEAKPAGMTHPKDRHQACSRRIQGVVCAQPPVRIQALCELLCDDVSHSSTLRPQQQLQYPCACRVGMIECEGKDD